MIPTLRPSTPVDPQPAPAARASRRARVAAALIVLGVLLAAVAVPIGALR